jgi:Family of unknown function (DUF7002)
MTRSITTLYHLVDAANWPRVRSSGLKSARRLFAESKPFDLDERPIWRRHCTESIVLSSGARIRDQKPMPPKALRNCLNDGLTPEDWYELLNAKVFFWVDPERLDRQRRVCGAAPQLALVIDTDRLLARYIDTACVTPINTGNAMRAAARRGYATFVPYRRWQANGWSSEAELGGRIRPASHRPVEVTIEDAVPDIMEFITARIHLEEGEALFEKLLRESAKQNIRGKFHSLETLNAARLQRTIASRRHTR